MSTMSKGTDTQLTSERVACLDAYRGFVILMMIWVNYIGEMPGIPDWLRHATADQDTFTIPDLVFPGFLFMVGLAMPLALGRRLAQGTPASSLISKILWRSLGLILAGVVMVNGDRYDEAASLLPRTWFFLLFYVSLAIIWLQGDGKRGFRFLSGMALLLFLMVSFRGTVNDEFKTPYLQHSWWGILGLIGWAYLAGSLLYLSVKGSATALMGLTAFLLAVFMGGAKGRLDFLPSGLTDLVGIGELGSTTANVLAGAVVGSLFLPAAPGAAETSPHARRVKFMLFFSAGSIAAALLLRPYNPISKIYATETFTLVTVGVNLAMFTVFYILMDVLRLRAWAAFLVPVGTNALLAYILPDFWNMLMRAIHLEGAWWRYGWHYLAGGGMAGLANAAGVSLFMVFLTYLGTKAGLRLKL